MNRTGVAKSSERVEGWLQILHFDLNILDHFTGKGKTVNSEVL